jgi:hypothetical protein
MADIMNEVVKNVVVDYKDITSWILLVIVIVTGIFQYLQNVRLAKTVEKFKGDLAKNQVRFTRHSELQIECLKNYYDLIVTLHFGYTLVQSKKDHHGLKKCIKTTQDDFLKVLFYSHRNRILLTDEIVTQFQIVHEKFKIWNSLTSIELNEMDGLEDYECSSDVERIYKNSDVQINSIKQRIKNLNKNKDIKTIENEILMLRKLIENYFKQLVG